MTPDVKVCLHCGEPYTRPSGETAKRWAQRKFCSAACSNRAHLGSRTHCPQGHPYDEENTRLVMQSGGPARHCRACQRERTKAWQERNKAERAAYARAHRQRPGEREKNNARARLRGAVADGKIAKPETCEECGLGGQIEGHHEDYSRPLDVRWLCIPCHRDLHQRERAAA